jgi:hypothetical protein
LSVDCERGLRKAAKPRPAKPSIMITQVEVSGTVESVTLVIKSPCWFDGPGSVKVRFPPVVVKENVSSVQGEVSDKGPIVVEKLPKETSTERAVGLR